jgi:hypothetical protein
MNNFTSGYTYRVGNFEVAKEIVQRILMEHGYEVHWDRTANAGVAHKGKRFGLLAAKEPYIQLRLSFPANTPNPSFRLESRAGADLGTLTDDLFAAFDEAGLNYAITNDGTTGRGVSYTSGMAGVGYGGGASQGTGGSTGPSELAETTALYSRTSKSETY